MNSPLKEFGWLRGHEDWSYAQSVFRDLKSFQWEFKAPKVLSLEGSACALSFEQAVKKFPEKMKIISKRSSKNPFVAFKASNDHSDALCLFVPAHAKGHAQIHYGTRLFIFLETGSQLTITEEVSQDQVFAQPTFFNSLTDIDLASQSNLQFLRRRIMAPKIFDLEHVRVAQHGSSVLEYFVSPYGGFRHDVAVSLQGEGAFCDLKGMSFGKQSQHCEFNIHVDHEVPRCVSQQKFKGIYTDSATGIFCGKIFVHEGAVETKAKQSSKSLLLSNEAKAHAKPQLEILNDNVKCTHGSTVGQLRFEELFYLRSRGISEAKAKQMLCEGFLGELIPDELKTMDWSAFFQQEEALR